MNDYGWYGQAHGDYEPPEPPDTNNYCEACDKQTDELYSFDHYWLCNDCFEYELAVYRHENDGYEDDTE